MKLLTITVPCYNSQEYMRKCLDSLLPGGDEVEILIVNDGSKDDTAKIGAEYAEKYPNIVRLINKENGGHGSAVNCGIREAQGAYLKIVDSDDWVDEEAYRTILAKLREFVKLTDDNQVDLLISNYVYEKVGEKNKKVIQYTPALPTDVVFSWERAKHFKIGQYILMHSTIFRTQLLRDSGLVLPEHTFYVDNLYVFTPLPLVKNLYYLDVNFYRYFIGREDQSVHESVMIKRIDQQIRVNKMMFDFYSGLDRTTVTKPLYIYMHKYLEIICSVSTILLLKANTKESLAKNKELWAYMKKTNRKEYRKLRWALMGFLLHMPGRVGRRLCVFGYKICQKIFKFN